MHCYQTFDFLFNTSARRLCKTAKLDYTILLILPPKQAPFGNHHTKDRKLASSQVIVAWDLIHILMGGLAWEALQEPLEASLGSRSHTRAGGVCPELIGVGSGFFHEVFIE
jgi:hypothetical protein